jgi:hypothetical protein
MTITEIMTVATKPGDAVSGLRPTDWLERVRAALRALDARGEMPMPVALRLTEAVNALQLAEKRCSEWEARSIAQ